jgi:cell division protein FtsX
MEIKISLDQTADLVFIEKLLSQIKGISKIEFLNKDKKYSWQELENSEDFRKVMEQSEDDYKKGNVTELTDDFLDEIFDK